MDNRQFILALLDKVDDVDVERRFIIELLSMCDDYDGLEIPEPYKKFLFDKTGTTEENFPL